MMTTLDDEIYALTTTVVNGSSGLDEALEAVEDWVSAHGASLDDRARAEFRKTLDRDSSNDNRSLVDSVLRLHATRLLYRFDAASQPPPPDESPSDYTEARNVFYDALRASEDGLREARIDIAIANAHHLLGNLDGNRRWLDSAFRQLQPLATTDLVALAGAIPAMPLPTLGGVKRWGLRLLGVDLSRLSERNRESFVTLAQLQTNQIVMLAHLIGTSYQAVRERQRANRAFRVVAHLVMRHDGMAGVPAGQMLEIAEDIAHAEAEAARVLAHEAYVMFRAEDDESGQVRARVLLEQ